MNKITRVKNKDYTTISNLFMRDKNLSLKAKGLLATILSLPEDWDFSISGICAIVKEGKTAVYSAIDELKEYKYCTVEVSRDENGRITGNDYTFIENPYTENLNMDNQPQLNKDLTNSIPNTDITINKEINKKEYKEKKGDDIFVDSIYAMYPSKCPVRNTSLGKCSKDKDRIRKLLKTYSKEDIEKVVAHEVKEKFGKSMMQNFSTFLNNFPDPENLFSTSQGGTIAYPRDVNDVKEEDIMRTYDFFRACMNMKHHRLLDSIRKGFPSNEEEFQYVLKRTKFGAAGFAYIILVMERDGFEPDERGFMYVYAKILKDKGLAV